MRVPKPKVGMVVIDPAHPQHDWTVVQYAYNTIYLRREDGWLHHHTEKSWKTAFENRWLSRQEEDRG
jgi:hypothetical protein